MSKKLILIFTLTSLILLATGCAKNNASTNNTTKELTPALQNLPSTEPSVKGPKN